MVLKNLFNSHNDDKHYGSAKRDAANGVAGIDASKEIINDVPVAKLIDMDEQSFINLLANGNFESWSAGVSAAPDTWTYSQSGTGGGVARSVDEKIGDYSAEITKSNSGNSRISNLISEYEHYKTKDLTFGCWIKSANTVSGQVGLELYDGVGTSYAYYQNSGNWEFIEVTRTINASSTQIKAQVRVITGADAVAYIDGAILVEGSVCPAFSPKPLVDDGKSIAIDSATNKVTFGGLIIYSQTPQILTGAGAIDLTSIITHLVTGGAGADAVTLADGIEGQHKTIIMKTITTGGDTSVVTPVHFANGTTITGNSVGDIQNMMFSNGAWHWTGGRGAIIA